MCYLLNLIQKQKKQELKEILGEKIVDTQLTPIFRLITAECLANNSS